MVAKKKI